MKFKRLKELSDDVYHQEIQSVFPSILKVVSHMYIVDQLWFHIISGKDMPIGSRKKQGKGKVLKKWIGCFTFYLRGIKNF
ncbi:DinB family protein [Fictibacillus sp. B-59209]|uniref:DinB family protein n=2 Tax=unclassified Fictibacillus TaxID=2644029 RepID=UPI003CD0E0CE